MNGFWTGGSDALHRGATAEYNESRDKLLRRLEAAADEEERLRLKDEIKRLKETHADLLDGTGQMLF